MKRLILIFILVVNNAFGAFTYYSPIVVDHTKVPSTQTNFPVLISITDTRLKTTGNGGHVQNASGFDVRPYSDVGLTTAITGYELERYNATTGEVVMWVNIASLSSSVDTTIYLAYGDTALSSDASSTSTWDANYMGVWHLKDGTTLALTDSTSNARTLTNTASVAAASGKVDGGAGTFNGTTQALNTAAFNPATNKVTLSMWANFSAFANDDDLMAETSTNMNSANGAIFVNPNGSTTNQFDILIHNNDGYSGGWFTRPSTGLHHFVFEFDSTVQTPIAGVYAWVDGSSQSITFNNVSVQTGLNFGNFALYIMSRAATSLFHSATVVDEVKFSKTLRSADWITTEYNNQNAPGSFETLGTEVALSTSTGNFFIFFSFIERLFTWHPFLNESH